MTLGVTNLDTAYNYRGFTSHRTLASTASDLLSEFTISTKVGFFPSSRGPEHCLDPARLRQAVHQSVQDLGTQPDMVLLHNPERTLAELAPEQGRDRWSAACTALEDLTAAGWCRSWGVACWDPRPVLTVLDRALPAPALVMVRAGLMVRAEILDASEKLAIWFGLGRHARWGMSPYGGQTTHPVWDEVNARQSAPGRSGPYAVWQPESWSAPQARPATCPASPTTPTPAPGHFSPMPPGLITGAVTSSISSARHNTPCSGTCHDRP